MSRDTDVESVVITPASAPYQIIAGPCRILGIFWQTNIFQGGMELYDGTDSSGTPAITAYTEAATLSTFESAYVNIPGNGVRFSDGVYIELPDDIAGGSNAVVTFGDIEFQRG